MKLFKKKKRQALTKNEYIDNVYDTENTNHKLVFAKASGGRYRPSIITFFGTRKELVKFLKDKNFFENDKEHQNYVEKNYLFSEEHGNVFGEFTIDFNKKHIIESVGRIYSMDSKPSYPQQINICINAEGFSQHEINKAISSLHREMEKNRTNKKEEGFKEFYIEKQGV